MGLPFFFLSPYGRAGSRLVGGGWGGSSGWHGKVSQMLWKRKCDHRKSHVESTGFTVMSHDLSFFRPFESPRS